MTTIADVMEKFYADHEVKPFISPERDLEAWLLDPKPVSKRNMELLRDGLLAGDIILLWRIHFGTFTTETWFPKYFEYSYGIHASEHLKGLSKMKAADLSQALSDHFTEEKLAEQFTIRGYQLTDKGKQALKDYQVIIDCHPKKNI